MDDCAPDYLFRPTKDELDAPVIAEFDVKAIVAFIPSTAKWGHAVFKHDGVLLTSPNGEIPSVYRRYALFCREEDVCQVKAIGRILAIPARPNNHGDQSLFIEFATNAKCAEAKELVDAGLQRSLPRCSTAYFCMADQDSFTAVPLRRDHPVVSILDDVLTEIAYGQGAKVLTPIYYQDVHANNDPDAYRRLSARYRTSPPPRILIADDEPERFESSPMGEPTGFCSFPRLPDTPSTFDTGLPLPSDALIISPVVERYGAHIRSVDGPLSLSLSQGLVNLLVEILNQLEAQEGRQSDNPGENLDRTLSLQNSRDAVTFAIKISLLHELGHCIATSMDPSHNDTPPRTCFKNATKKAFQRCEDPETGNIEAGVLVEACYIHHLTSVVFDNDGYVAIAVRESELAVEESSDSKDVTHSVSYSGATSFYLVEWPFIRKFHEEALPMGPTLPMVAPVQDTPPHFLRHTQSHMSPRRPKEPDTNPHPEPKTPPSRQPQQLSAPQVSTSLLAPPSLQSRRYFLRGPLPPRTTCVRRPKN